jgi:hypothetical protein
MNYSEEHLIALAQTNPQELYKILINPRTPTTALMLGVEILANEVKNEEIVLPVLKRLLNHVNAGVRENAVISVCSFYINNKPPQDILDRVQEIANNDPSFYLKEYAKDVLLKY